MCLESIIDSLFEIKNLNYILILKSIIIMIFGEYVLNSKLIKAIK